MTEAEREMIRWAVSARNANWWGVAVSAVSAAATFFAVVVALLLPERQRKQSKVDRRNDKADLYAAAALSAITALELVEVPFTRVGEVLMAPGLRAELSVPKQEYVVSLAAEADTILHFLRHELHDPSLVSLLIRAEAMTRVCANISSAALVPLHQGEETTGKEALQLKSFMASYATAHTGQGELLSAIRLLYEGYRIGHVGQSDPAR